ncbi:MAG: hypothetical protein CM15mV4_1980 [Caudoviricetes sp.]|nr:MAG: hypothetical protein CM15mV4_1980 [Caudoviricetes sp.]
MENSTENKDWNDYRYSYYSSRHENVKKNEIYIDENTFHLMNFVSSRSNLVSMRCSAEIFSVKHLSTDTIQDMVQLLVLVYLVLL